VRADDAACSGHSVQELVVRTMLLDRQ
jgi:hypothetical protein